MAQQTAVEWLIENFMINGFIRLTKDQRSLYKELRDLAKQMEKEKILDDLIGFQIYLNNKGLITNHDWDFEKMAKLYIKKEYGKKIK